MSHYTIQGTCQIRIHMLEWGNFTMSHNEDKEEIEECSLQRDPGYSYPIIAKYYPRGLDVLLRRHDITVLFQFQIQR